MYILFRSNLNDAKSTFETLICVLLPIGSCFYSCIRNSRCRPTAAPIRPHCCHRGMLSYLMWRRNCLGHRYRWILDGCCGCRVTRAFHPGSMTRDGGGHTVLQGRCCWSLAHWPPWASTEEQPNDMNPHYRIHQQMHQMSNLVCKVWRNRLCLNIVTDNVNVLNMQFN